MPKNTSEFHVKLEGIKFSSKVEKRIEAGIQSLIMNELAGYKPNPDDPDGRTPGLLGNPIIIVKPKLWPGFIVMKLEQLDEKILKRLKVVEQTIGS